VGVTTTLVSTLEATLRETRKVVLGLIHLQYFVEDYIEHVDQSHLIGQYAKKKFDVNAGSATVELHQADSAESA
jgi:hypothetical protein